MSLSKVVLVTGASAGIGEATALLFAKKGASVALVGRNEAALSQVARKCGANALPIVADLTTDEGCGLVAEKTLAHYGRLDVLVNNAGVGAREHILTAGDMGTFDRAFGTNVRAVYDLTRRLVPALVHSKGNIVNVSSIAGSTPVLGILPYGMSKAALNHFTRLIALELAPKGVRVNTVSPGITVSKSVQRVTGMSDAEYQAWLNLAENEVPMRQKVIGNDVAEAIVHLASPACALVTGTNLNVDAGARFIMGGSKLYAAQEQKK